ncbi:MAG: AAA family ATPase [Actinomycetota bacterium]|nr:AAA family ATPase [Actinomycetota bacterium]
MDRGPERKLATVLFVDLTGATGLGERLDAESLKDVLGAFLDAMTEEIHDLGGTVGKYIGDAIMAIFGVPVAHDDDPIRALRCAQRMGSRLKQLNASLAASHDVSLEMRIGINTGELLVTPGASIDGALHGDVLNVAARLEQSAQPGKILVSERTVRSSRGFGFEDVGMLQLRGREQPLHVFELAGLIESDRSRHSLTSAPLVGRDNERAVLMSLFERAVLDGQPHLVTVYGAAGLGKTRLVDEFVASLETFQPTPTVLRGRCFPYGEDHAYGAMIQILKTHAGLLDDDPPDLKLTKIRKTVDELLASERGADHGRVAAVLAFASGINDPTCDLRGLSPRQIRAEIVGAWRSFFTAMARHSPIVVIIEDMHWADRVLLDLLEELEDRIAGPAMFLCPTRPELTDLRPGWGGGRRRFSSLLLDPLTTAESNMLLDLVLENSALPEGLRRDIMNRAEGNPFFIEEILRRLADEGSIVRSEGVWHAADAIDDVDMPDTVQAVIAARIDLLAPDEKRALQCAAVIGRVFWTGVLGTLLAAPPDDVTHVLDRLEDRELVIACFGSTLGNEREYLFKHGLTRDVAYESLGRKERTSLHRRAAEWIEKTAADRRSEVIDVLAYHLYQAHQGASADNSVSPPDLEVSRKRAFEALIQASDESTRRTALDIAKRQAHEAVELAATTEEKQRAEEALGLAYFFGYEGDEAWMHLRRSIDLLVETRPNDQRDIARLCARTLETPIRWPGTMQSVPSEETVSRYLDLGFDHVGDGDSVERARLLTVKAFWQHAFPRSMTQRAEPIVSAEDSLRAGTEAAEMAARLGRPDLESGALDGVAANDIPEGRYGRAREVTERRLELAPHIDDLWERADIYAMGGWTNFHIGRYRDAYRFAVIGFNQTRGEAASAALHCLTWRGVSRFRLGDWDGVLTDLEIARELLGDRFDEPPNFVSPLFAAAAAVSDARGDTATADRILALLGALHENAEPRDRDIVPLAQWASYVSPILTRRGKGEEALRLLAETTWRRGTRMGLLLHARCDVIGAMGSWDEVPDLVAESRDHARRMGLEALSHAADVLEGRWLLASGSIEPAAVILAEAVNGFGDLGARWDQVRAALLLVDALQLSGRFDEASTELGAIHSSVESLGAVQEQARFDELEALITKA